MPRNNRSGKDGGKDEQSSPPQNTAPTTIIEPGQRPEKIYPRVPVHPVIRLYAAIVDWFILIVLVVVVRPFTEGVLFYDDTVIQNVIVFFAYWVLPTGFWGQTPGKWVAGIIVIDQDGRVPGVSQAIPREMVGRVISIAAFLIGIIWIMFAKDRQGWHDKIAGTYVIRKKDASAPGPFKFLGRPELFRRKRK
jgi:uncharacterized RDD family membrane protein YckC